ncbi:MAG: hypothetical protein AVDCRST_MAG43-1202 [uncultured Thermomicrobiales bacterium]|uniref:Uncharacterized protein n=1 Tax=uncultured Thermomicrobiales bacterium TaxID=1645740 RepID=A0A6J4UJY6_9BACT|nr:MAG: hypothetical protein AVDCRST_MAG43-1202 [uncultured Thermomicrobiales bacterium]
MEERFGVVRSWRLVDKRRVFPLRSLIVKFKHNKTLLQQFTAHGNHAARSCHA